MTDVQITELFYEQLEALSEYDEDGVATRAALMKKQISIWNVAEGISGISLQEKRVSEDGNAGNNDMVPIFLQYTDSLIAAEENLEVVEQAMNLLSALAVTYGEPTSEAIADKAMEYSTVLLERVRCQACKLMGYLALHLSRNEEEWAEEWFDALKESMLPRLSDKSQSVRLCAVRASAFFFGKSAHTEDLLESVLWCMWHDPSVTIRVAALDAVPINSETVPHIVTRIRDEKEKVRLQALDVLKNKVDPVLALDQQQFSEIIKSGLSIRCNATKRETEKMICSKWMKSAKFSPVEMVQLMGAINYEEECEKALQVVLDSIWSGDTDVVAELSAPEVRAFQESENKNLISFSDASVDFRPEQLFFVRLACCLAQTSDHLSPIQKENIINKVAPDIQVLCQLLVRRIGMLVEAGGNDNDGDEGNIHSFVCLQLLRLAQVVGLREEGSRRLFLSAIQEILSAPETPDDLVEDCIQSLRAAHESEQDFLATISITVSEILALGDDSGKNQTHLALRNLSILTIVLENVPANMTSHHSLDDFTDFILESVQSPSALVREAGVSVLGRLGMLVGEATVIDVYKPLLLSLASNQKEKLEIRSQALMALSDWSLLFPQVLRPCHCDERMVSLLDVVSETIQHKNTTMMAFSAEVAVKLLLAGRICESSLIARLLVIFFDSELLDVKNDDVDDKEIGSPIRLQQVLSLYFPAYCIKSESGRDALLGSIESALMIANKQVKSKRKRSAFPFVRLVEFVCDVVDSGKQAEALMHKGSEVLSSPSGDDLVDNSMTRILASIQIARFLSKDDSLTLTETRTLSKFLASQDIKISKENSFNLHVLKTQIDDLLMFLTDTTSLRAIESLHTLLGDLPENIYGDQFASEASSQGTVTDDEAEDTENESTGETTVEESLMESMTALSVRSKENRRGRSSKKDESSENYGSDANRGVLSNRANIAT